MPQEAVTNVIPIHTSDTGTFKRCRRRWDWTSPTRGNLRPKVSVQGINFNLAFGTAVHTALERYYQGKQAGLEVAIADEFAHEWLQLTNAVNDRNEWFYQEHAEEFAYHADLGVGMMNYYADWAKDNDDFTVVATEHLFSVDTGIVARDRETGEVLPVHYRGRMDMVVRDNRTGRYGVMDHKTSSRHDDEDYLLKLDMDEQVTRYMWAAELEAQQYDLPYKRISFVLYNVLFKAYPKPPTLTSRGVPSINRQTESTTAELFAEMVMGDEAMKAWFLENEKAQGYYNYLKEAGNSRFLHREMVKRNDYELDAAGKRIHMEILDMLREDLHIYPNATGEWYCLKCPFRAPCIAAMDGSDVSFMLEQGYEPNMDSEGQYTNV